MDKLVVRGVTYDVSPKGYMYLQGKRVSKEAVWAEMKLELKETSKTVTDNNEELERAENKALNKGDKMNYNDKLEAFGITRAELEKKVGKVAYKPMSEYQGKEYSGSYLVNLKGKARVISELTYQGKLQIFDVNTKTLGFYMDDLYNLADCKQIGEFESVRPSTLSLDDLGQVDEPEQLVDTISVWRVKFADLDMVTFLNETTSQFHGSKLYAIYEAEQKARLSRPSMDELFDGSVEHDIKELEAERGHDKKEQEVA